VKKITVAILLLVPALARGGADPSPAEFTVEIHVSSSGIATSGRQDLNVIVNGQKYELLSESVPNALLALGDYKAKLVKDEHRTGYDSFQVYEFLFADKKTRKFEVIGHSE